MFTKFFFSAALVQSLVSGTHATPTLSEPVTAMQAPAGGVASVRRNLAEGGQVLTINNNCDSGISHFKAMYNVYYESGWQYQTTGSISIGLGESLTVNDVTGTDLYFYGLNFDGSGLTEVVTAAQTSNVWTHVTFTVGDNQYEFPFYMEEIGSDMVVNLCSDDTPEPPPEPQTLTIENNCADDINYFKAMYNVEYNSGWQSETTGSVSISSGSSITVDGVTGDDIHFYALHYDGSISEVATTDETSNVWTHVTFTIGDTPYDFPFYVEAIGEDMLVQLCGNQQVAPPSSEPQTVTIYNDCGTNINYFKALYNADYDATFGWQFDSMDRSIASGSSLTIDNVVDDELHFYALHWNGSTVTEVASTAERSNVRSHVTFTVGEDKYDFPFYAATIGADMSYALCGSN